jgi:Lon protease-like protein
MTTEQLLSSDKESTVCSVESTERTPGLSKDDFTCALCQSLLFEPVTTACGHTFCRECILRALDHSSQCPLCRTVIHLTPDHAINVLISQLVQKLYPLDFKARKDEVDKLRDHKFQLPLFVLEYVLFPGTQLQLHVFEPRYRLMIRRCLDGSRTFGVLRTDEEGNFLRVGCTATIESFRLLPDGRSILTTRGQQRFRVLSLNKLDGYWVAKVDYFDDRTPASTRECQQLTRRILDKLTKVLTVKNLDVHDDDSEGDNEMSVVPQQVLSKQGNKLTQIPKVREWIEQYGPMPNTPKEFSHWISCAFTTSNDLKQELLEMTSTEARLCKILEELESSTVTNPKSCLLQ